MEKTESGGFVATISLRLLQAALHSVVLFGEARITLFAVYRSDRISRRRTSRGGQNPRALEGVIRGIPCATQPDAREASEAALAGWGRAQGCG
jgi:hypothetical protein